MKTAITNTSLGFGLGLRAKHIPYILEHKPTVDWFEIISENYMDTEGKPHRNLERIAQHYPIVMHGVSLSIGTVDTLNSEYLKKLKKLIDTIKPAWISDHLCWTGVAHKNTHDLLPLPYTEESLRHIIQRIREVQDFLERPIALENPSTYLEFKSSSMSEAEFLTRMTEESGCHLLLDVNNIYVTCYNHRLDAKAYLDSLPLNRVIQIHLAGHTNKGTHIIDTHDNPVTDDVLNLYKYTLHKAGRIPNTMIEWDDNIPDFSVLYAELEKVRKATKDTGDYVLQNLAQTRIPFEMKASVTLRHQQETMQTAIMSSEINSNPETWIRPKNEFSAQKQLEVYVNAYHWRLFDVVAEDYPVLKAYLGEERFNILINDFISIIPPQHFNIARYAAFLPVYYKTHSYYDVFAGELCDLETAIAQLADAPETKPLMSQHLKDITPEMLMELTLYPRKALQLFTFSFLVNDFYNATKIEEKTIPNLTQQDSYLVVFRHDDVVWRMDLQRQEYELLSVLFDGKAIGEALSGLDESASDNISEYFSRWIRNGLLAEHEYIL